MSLRSLVYRSMSAHIRTDAFRQGHAASRRRLRMRTRTVRTVSEEKSRNYATRSGLWEGQSRPLIHLGMGIVPARVPPPTGCSPTTRRHRRPPRPPHLYQTRHRCQAFLVPVPRQRACQRHARAPHQSAPHHRDGRPSGSSAVSAARRRSPTTVGALLSHARVAHACRGVNT